MKSSKGEKGVNPLKPLGVSVEVAGQNAGSPRNPESFPISDWKGRKATVSWEKKKVRR